MCVFTFDPMKYKYLRSRFSCSPRLTENLSDSHDKTSLNDLHAIIKPHTYLDLLTLEKFLNHEVFIRLLPRIKNPS